MKDILLHLDSYPEPTPHKAIDQAVGFAAMLDAGLSTVAVQVLLRAPSHALANALIGIAAMAEEERAKSAGACKDLITRFEAAAKAQGVFESTIQAQADFSSVGDFVAQYAKTRDLCLVPVAQDQDGQRGVAETVIFASGRPTLVFRPDAAALPQSKIGTVVLAWDNSRTAARAMADALPLLKLAEKVKILTVTNEKSAAATGIGRDALRHVSLYDIKAEIAEVDGAGKSIGASLDAYLDSTTPDLLVMGAYGASRLREFILGGATAHVLARVKVPVFLVH